MCATCSKVGKVRLTPRKPRYSTLKHVILAARLARRNAAAQEAMTSELNDADDDAIAYSEAPAAEATAPSATGPAVVDAENSAAATGAGAIASALLTHTAAAAVSAAVAGKTNAKQQSRAPKEAAANRKQVAAMTAPSTAATTVSGSASRKLDVEAEDAKSPQTAGAEQPMTGTTGAGTATPTASSSDPALECAARSVHSARFREYCTQLVSRDVNQRAYTIIRELAAFQKRAAQADPVKVCFLHIYSLCSLSLSVLLLH